MVKKIQRLGFWAFTAYLPALIFILAWLAPGKYQGFSFQTHWLSNLGAKSSPAYLFFFISLNLLSFLGLFFIIKLASHLPHRPVSRLFLSFLITCLVIISLIAFSPMDTQTARHYLLAELLLANFLILNLLAIILNLKTSLWPKLLLLLNLAIIFFTVLFGVSLVKIMQKYYFLDLSTLKEVVKREESIFLKGNTIWEWLMVSLEIIWLFLASIFLLP